MATHPSPESGDIAPQPGTPQEAFLSLNVDIGLMGGGAGGGKTYGLLLEPLYHIQNSDFGAVIFRRTTKQVRQEGGLLDTSQGIYGPLGATWNDTKLTWTFGPESRVTFAHMEHEKDRFNWKGAQIPLVGFDQVEDFTEKMFWYLVSRNRSVSGVQPYLRATCNPVPPEDPTGGWLHDMVGWYLDDEGYPHPDRAGEVRWFIRHDNELIWANSRPEAEARRRDLGLPEEVEPKSFTFIPATVHDNPALMEADPTYLSRLHTLTRVEKERLLGGNWLVRPAAGLIFDRADFNIGAAPPAGEGVKRVMYVDKAGTEAAGASYTVILLLAHTPNGLTFIEDVTRDRWKASRREKVIRQKAEAVAREYGKTGFQVVVEQEPGSSGKESAENTISNLQGFRAYADKPSGDKFDRADPFAAQVQVGNVYLCEGGWVEDYLRELHNAEPGAEYLDQMDASSGAYNWVTQKWKRGKTGGTWGTGRRI